MRFPRGPGGVHAILLATGSEVGVALEAAGILVSEGIRARVVSMPSMEIFQSQGADYRDSVLPVGVKRVSVEAAHPMSWQRWVGSDGVALGLDRFGASPPYKEIYEHLGLTIAKIVETAKQLTSR